MAVVDEGHRNLAKTVTSDDPADAEQVSLIRMHLRAEADRFATGDFGDPAQIHGAMMPGLAELSAAAGAIRIELQRSRLGRGVPLLDGRPRTGVGPAPMVRRPSLRSRKSRAGAPLKKVRWPSACSIGWRHPRIPRSVQGRGAFQGLPVGRVGKEAERFLG